MRSFTGVLSIVLLIAVVIFAFQNLQAVEVSFLVWSLSFPKIFLILGTYLLGILSGGGLLMLLRRG